MSSSAVQFHPLIKPPCLKEGDRVRLVAPAGPVPDSRIRAALTRCEDMGLEPELGTHARGRLGYLAGLDEERAADLQEAFEADGVAAIWALRGGYGSVRLLDRLNFAPLREQPRALIGFSDNTMLHLALDRAGLVSFHGPHAGADELPDETMECFRRVLFQPEPAGLLPFRESDPEPVTLAPGIAEGPLIGGNLALLASSCGTRTQLQAWGRIVVIEDVGEAVYRIDRMLTQLVLSGALDGAVGIAFGRFTEIPQYRDGRPIEEVLLEWVEPLGIPAAFGLAFGHVDHNWTLPFGVSARLDAGNCTLEILESAVQ